MKTVVGVDRCKTGWVSVALTGDDAEVKVFDNIRQLWMVYEPASVILIDIPIGLPDGGKEARDCDHQARQLLGPRRRSVFPVPVRDVLQCDTYEEACAVNYEKTGKKISKQAWNIVPKIKEVDELLLAKPKSRKKIRESHPEVCFMTLQHQPMDHAKKNPVGFLDRLQMLQQFRPDAEKIIRQAAREYKQRAVASDDVMDALALAITASVRADKLKTLPKKPPKDGEGLRMEMVYRVVNEK